jgi:hypothetical protein
MAEFWRFVLIAVYFGALLVISFLTIMNGYLDGRLRLRVDAVLSIALIGLVAFGFYKYGWKGGLFIIFVCFVQTVAITPIARRAAAHIAADRQNRQSGSFFKRPP